MKRYQIRYATKDLRVQGCTLSFYNKELLTVVATLLDELTPGVSHVVEEFDDSNWEALKNKEDGFLLHTIEKVTKELQKDIDRNRPPFKP